MIRMRDDHDDTGAAGREVRAGLKAGQGLSPVA
jgi:hypothetical protein